MNSTKIRDKLLIASGLDCIFGFGSPCLYTVSGNIPNIIDCHLKKGYPILITLGTNVSGTAGHQMAVQYSTSPNVCFCTTWGKQNQRNMSQDERKYVVKHQQLYQSIDFNNFKCKHFWNYLPLNHCSSSQLIKCLFLHYLGKTWTDEIE